LVEVLHEIDAPTPSTVTSPSARYPKARGRTERFRYPIGNAAPFVTAIVSTASSRPAATSSVALTP
jgi:hypothetical protein